MKKTQAIEPADLVARARAAADAVEYLADYLKAYKAIEALTTVQREDVDLSSVDRNDLAWLYLVVNASVSEKMADARNLSQEVVRLVYQAADRQSQVLK